MKILAQNDNVKEYTVLAPLPGTTCTSDTCSTNDPTKASLGSYIPGLFNLMIGVAAVIAVAYIIWGGIEYITTDSWNGKQDGKNRIWNAVIGLVIVITSYLILYTINPNLLNLNLNIEPTTVTAPAGTLANPFAAGVSTPGARMTDVEVNASNYNRVLLQSSNITTYAGPCTSGQTTGCVNLNGLTTATIDSLSSLGKSCGPACMIITGGTESGHSVNSTHTQGTTVDMTTTPGLQTFLGVTNPVGNTSATGQKQAPTTVTKVVDGKTVTFTYEAKGDNGISSGAHWHVLVTP
jgi:hypothetical protein